MTLRGFFLAADGRLHAPWRILVFLLISIVCAEIITLTASPLLAVADRLTGQSGTSGAIAFAIAMIAAHAVMLYLVDRRSWSVVGLDRAAARPAMLATGWLLGALPILLPSLLLIAAGWLAIRPSPHGSWWLAAAQVSLWLLPAALIEELVARGYLFATLREWLGWPAAVVLSSVLFGLAHRGNPGANAQSVLMVTLAGVFLAAVLLVTGSLYAAWMAHWAWNWVMAVALHIAVSGLPMPRPDYQTVDAGPDLVTGGSWGPEGGLAAAAGMIAGLAFLWSRRRWSPWLPHGPRTPETTSEIAHDER